MIFLGYDGNKGNCLEVRSNQKKSKTYQYKRLFLFHLQHVFEQNHPQYHNGDGRNTSSDEDTDEYLTASEGDGPHEVGSCLDRIAFWLSASCTL